MKQDELETARSCVCEKFISLFSVSVELAGGRDWRVVLLCFDGVVLVVSEMG